MIPYNKMITPYTTKRQLKKSTTPVSTKQQKCAQNAESLMLVVRVGGVVIKISPTNVRGLL